MRFEVPQEYCHLMTGGSTGPEVAGAGGRARQGALFLRPCFQIVLHGSGREARIGVRVLAAPAPDGGS